MTNKKALTLAGLLSFLVLILLISTGNLLKKKIPPDPGAEMLFIPTPPLGWRIGDTVMWRRPKRTQRILITKGNCDTTLINVQDSPYVNPPDQYISLTKNDTTK